MVTHESNRSSPIEGILQKALTEVMLVTIVGSPDRARPMQVAQIDDDASLWFIAPVETAALGEWQVGTVTTQIGARWLHMTGRFERATVLLHFIPDTAELWDTTAVGGMSQPIEAAHGCSASARPAA